MKYIMGLVFFVSLATSALAEQRNIFIGVKSGVADIQLIDEYASNGTTEEGDMASVAFYAGYNFDSGLLAEVELSDETSDAFIFESDDVAQTIAMLGYTIELGTDFRIIPKAGFSSWELDTYDSNFLFGDEEERSFNGTNMIWSVEGEYSLNGLIQFNLGYRQGDYDFGDLDAFRFGVEFDF